jgi:DNA-binding transcriptional LysR family regulator
MNIQAMDLNLLVAFEALIEERSVSRAALRIGLSQPAMSNALSRLRAAFGDPLFERRGQGMAPTPRAEQAAAAVRAGLVLLREALGSEPAFVPAQSSRTFRIALTDHAEWVLWPKLLARIRRAAPDLRLHIRRLESLFVAPEAELRSGALDAAVSLFSESRSSDPGTRLESLRAEPHVVALRKGHSLLRHPLTLERYAAADHVGVIYRAEAWGLIDQELGVRGFRRKLKLAVPHFLSALDAVASSDLIATLPRDLVRREGRRRGIASRPVPYPFPPVALRLAWHARSQNDPGVTWFLEQIRASLG